MTLVDLLGVALPIVQAPMAGSQGSALALAVAKAGALGSLPCAMLGPDALSAELERLRQGTHLPFNLNFFCHRAPARDPQREAAWRSALQPYYREFGLEETQTPDAPSRAPFDEAIAQLIEPYRPPVVSFHFGLPEPALVARVKSWGAKILSSATTVDEARWLEAHGADAIIAQGVEAGGHRGMFLSDDLTTQLGTFALLPQIVKAVRVPVIAAGGVSDAATVAAALRLGAAGVQVGTAYLLAHEASTSALHRAALQSSEAEHTALTNLFTGRPARGILNGFVREQGPLSPLAPAFPLASGAVAPLRAKAEAEGRSDFSPLWAGQNARLAAPGSAEEITIRLAQGLERPHSRR
ncbi:MAG TPA: nitronate monooxygenase [Polyangiales bacterium]|nr:nitronate monooxygenase [Polyangiales bacterium]